MPLGSRLDPAHAVLSGLVTLFAGLGVPIAIYLTVQHYEGAAPSCPRADWFAHLLANIGIGINCGAVTSSAYSRIGPTNVPISVPGLIWFVVSGGLAIWALLAAMGRLQRPDWLANARLAWSVIGLAFVIYLVYIEFGRLRLVCEWCTGVHILTLLTFIVVLVQWQREMAARYIYQR